MSSKKRKQKINDEGNKVKYLDNTAILDYVSENRIMQQSLVLIKKILHDEKCKERNLKFTDELALNLDKVEIEMKKGTSSEESKTVDFVIGLENRLLLLVEAKFDAKNMDNVAREMPKKIKHSKEILVGNTKFIDLYHKTIILLSSDNFEQNKTRLLNQLCNNTAYSPMNVKEFYSSFFEKR